MSEQQRPHDLINAIHNCAGMLHINRSHQRSFSFNILEANTRELIEAVQQVHDSDEGMRLMSQANRDASNQTHREITRHVHNFAVSALTLIEHTRIFMREHYAGTNLLIRYEKKVKSDFACDPLSQFVQKLRNYMVHKGLPNSEMFMELKHDPASSKGTTVETGIRISTDSLLKWDGWGVVARKYIESAAPDLDIRSVASDYLTRVTNFHQWLQSECDEYHRTDLEELDYLQTEFRARYPDLALPTAPDTDESPEQTLNDAAATIERLSATLHQNVRKIDLAQSRGNEFKSDRPIHIAITDEDIVDSPRLWTSDIDGRSVFVFIMTPYGTFGLDEEFFQQTRPLTEAILKLPWAKHTLSRAFIEDGIISWLKTSFETDVPERLDSYLEKATHEAVRPLALWAPVANLEIEASFSFGPVEFRPIAKAMLDEHETRFLESSQGNPDDINALFHRLREKMQGCTAVVIKMTGDPERLMEEGGEMAKVAVSLLRFMSPAAANPNITSGAALLGSELIPAHHWLVIGESSFNYSEGLDIHAVPLLRMSERALQALKSNLGALGSLVRPEGLTPFAFDLRSSLLLFSTGLTLADTLDRLAYCVSAVEKILLRHSAEAREFNIAARMQLIISHISPEESTHVPLTTRETYRLLARRDLAPLAPHQREAAHIFMSNAYRVLHLALDNVSQMETTQQFVDSIDGIAF